MPPFLLTTKLVEKVGMIEIVRQKKTARAHSNRTIRSLFEGNRCVVPFLQNVGLASGLKWVDQEAAKTDLPVSCKQLMQDIQIFAVVFM